MTSVIERFFTTANQNTLEAPFWINRKLTIPDGPLTKEVEIEVPDFWSQRACLTVATHYLKPPDDWSVKKMIRRVVDAITAGITWFSEEEATTFSDELAYALVHQWANFNSPVWYNLGVNQDPIINACYILHVEDDIESITDALKVEARIFKAGAGCGRNWSKLRASTERVSGEGFASGPVSFMKVADCQASVIRSGGKNRRAARLDCLGVDHPDILEFIRTKPHYEEMSKTLAENGWSTAMKDLKSVHNEVPFQSTNVSVRISNAFMNAYLKEAEWPLVGRTTGHKTLVPAKMIMKEIAQAIHRCGDPGIQFSDTITRWSTIGDRVKSSNPCQPGWATVLTPEGIRVLDDVDVGSTIWSGKRWTTIVAKKTTGIKTVRGYYTRAGTFYGTKKHRVLCRGKKVKVHEADAIDIATAKSASLKGILSNPQDVMDGLVFGDGMVHQASNNLIVLLVGRDDQEWRDSEVKHLFIEHKKGVKKEAWSISTTLKPKQVCRTYNRRVPKKFMRGTTVKKVGFLRGLYSANGSICSNRVTLKATSFKVIEQVQLILSSLGIRSYYTVNKPHDVEFENGVYTCRESYDLNITTDRDLFKRLIGFIQSDKNARLNAVCSSTGRRNWSKSTYDIVESRNLGKHNVWDITVDDPDHTYWTGGLLVSNCGEYLGADDTSCDLASINLFNQGELITPATLEQLTRLLTIALDVMIDIGSYPSETIERETKRYRSIGIGWSNVGGWLMAQGLPYDSDEGRSGISYLVSLTTAVAYHTSLLLGKILGPFPLHTKCFQDLKTVLALHQEAASQLGKEHLNDIWTSVNEQLNATEPTFPRNSSVTCAMPCGTTGHMMDCDINGIEPFFTLNNMRKHLSYGGTMVVENKALACGLTHLGYNAGAGLKWLEKKGSLTDFVSAKDLKVFDTCTPTDGSVVSTEAHLLMLAAIQPHLSHGMSKTINLPQDTKPSEIESIILNAWRLGIKCISIYRDGSKTFQPHEMGKKRREHPTKWGERVKLEDTRKGEIHKFTVGGVEGFLIPGFADDGRLMELFAIVSKQGGTIQGLLDSFCTSISYGLQHGVPLASLVERFNGVTFQPNGFSNGQFHPSIVSYIATYLGTFLNGKDKASVNEHIRDNVSGRLPCTSCGNLMVMVGGAKCWSCPTCGKTEGGCG